MVKERHFRSHFGTDPEVASSIWTHIRRNPNNELPRNAKIRHLLWALLFKTIFIKEIAKLASEEVSKFVLDVHEYFIHFIYPFEILMQQFQIG